jgi:hypothetical protein
MLRGSLPFSFSQREPEHEATARSGGVIDMTVKSAWGSSPKKCGYMLENSGGEYITLY